MFAQGRVIWSWDSVIHVRRPARSTWAARSTRSSAPRSASSSPTATATVWSGRPAPAQERIGHGRSAKHPRLVSDDGDAGRRLGGPDRRVPGVRGVRPGHRRDDAVRRVTPTPDMGALADEKNPAYFYAIDGRTAYWRDERGAVAADLDTGEVRVVDARRPERLRHRRRRGRPDRVQPRSRARGWASRPDDAGTMLRGRVRQHGRLLPERALLRRRRRRGLRCTTTRPATRVATRPGGLRVRDRPSSGSTTTRWWCSRRRSPSSRRAPSCSRAPCPAGRARR